MKKCNCYEEVQLYNPYNYVLKEYGICNGTKERDRCTCGGDPAKCDFYPEKREKALKENQAQKMANHRLKIYYAHHQWKYGTKIEDYEMDIIKAYFPNAWIFNPSEGLSTEGRTEEDIMKECLERVRRSDIVVFSSVDGVVGKGVYQEVKEAHINYKPVFYIHRDRLYTNVVISKNINSISDRTYGLVTFEDLDD